MSLLPAIIHATKPNPDATIIWLHGLGADGNDFVPIIPQLQLPDSLAIRFIFPNAPSIPVTVNGGYVMGAWYDIVDMSIDRKVDLEGLLKSADMIKEFITAEIEKGIDSTRIILVGFSQGGAVAYQAALSNSNPLAGLLALSTYFATADIIELSESNKNIPITIHHGKFDPVVPEQLGQKATTTLVKMGYSVNYQNYPMEHGVCPEQIVDISKWLKTILD